MKNIILIPSGPFLKRDYERFDIKILKKFFSVRILDLTPWLFPPLWELYSKQVYRCEEYTAINSKKNFSNSISKINSAIVIDHLSLTNRKTYWIRRQLKNKKSLFINLLPPNIPVTKINVVNQLKRLFYLFKKPKSFFYTIFKVLEARYYNLKPFTPDISIIGGLAALKESRSKKKIYAHFWDYDVYLNIKDKQVNNTIPYAVFLDEDMAYHSDYSMPISKAPLVDSNKYYPGLVKFLKKFEVETGLPICFAAHPKMHHHNLHNLSNLLQGIKCSIGNTAELVKNSKIVLLHASTSMSFAVLFRKPAVFLTSNELEQSWIGPTIKDFAKLMNSQIINISDELNKPLDIERLSKIDEAKYKYYLDEYIKMPNSPDLPLWKIFTNYISNNKI